MARILFSQCQYQELVDGKPTVCGRTTHGTVYCDLCVRKIVVAKHADDLRAHAMGIDLNKQDERNE